MSATRLWAAIEAERKLRVDEVTAVNGATPGEARPIGSQLTKAIRETNDALAAVTRERDDSAAEIKRLRGPRTTDGQWRPIETAPRDGTRLWLIQTTPGDYEGLQTGGRFLEYPYRRMEPAGEALFREVEGVTEMWCCDIAGLSPTHWQPLLAAPAPTDTGRG